MKNGNINEIADRQLGTFGPSSQSLKIARAFSEVAEAIASQKQPAEFVTEVADIWIVCSGAAVGAGCSNEGVQKIMNDNLNGGTSIPPIEMAMSLLVDVLSRWQTLVLQMEQFPDFEPHPQAEAILAYEVFWNLAQLARSMGVSFRELLEAIDTKMEINQSRTWDTTRGNSRHV